jgi:hypothetical protein
MSVKVWQIGGVSGVATRHAGEETTLLTCVIDGCIYVTYGPGQRRTESRASQPRPRLAAAVQATARSGRAVGPGVCDITTTGLSLSATSAAVEKAGTGAAERSEDSIYRQAVAQFNSASEAVRDGAGIVAQRSSQSGLAGTISERARAWLSRSPLHAALCSWNIASIVCCQTSWLRSTRHWYPTNAGPLKECFTQGRSPAWR